MALDRAGSIYGEALFEAAQASGKLASIQASLADVGGSLAGSPSLASALFNPAFPREGKRALLARLTQGAEPLVTNALQVLLDNNRLTSLPDALAAFEERYQQAERQLEVELTTAIEIDDAVADGVRAKLTAATGREVQLTRSVDPAILGGVVLRSRGKLVDASVRGRLDSLRLSLRSARLAGSATGGES